MFIHREARVAYLAHPRTASSSTEHALREVGFETAPEFYRHMPLGGSPWWARLPAEERDRWEVLTTVRNHFDALVSWWHLRPLRHPGGLSPAYVADLMRFEGTRFLTLDPTRLYARHLPSATTVLRFETLESDLRRALGARGLELGTFPHTNASRAREGRPYAPYYDDETREAVEERFSVELSELGYSFGG